MVKANASAPSAKDPDAPTGAAKFVIQSIWPNMPISKSPCKIGVIGATGEYASGKTILGLTIAPGLHPEGHPFAGKPRTEVMDIEQSTGTYQGTGAHRIDVIEEVGKTVTDPNTKKSRVPTPIDVFLWFRKHIEDIKPGQFDVIMVDPVTDIENGLVQYVRSKPAEFGYTSVQFEKGGGLIWGAVKDYWKVLLSTISSKCQTFYFTAHLRDEFSGATPTGKREPKGKETLLELASLYLWLERKPNAKGETPKEPSAIVLKQRLSDMKMSADGTIEMIPLMPPKIPVASAKEIRKYISHPPDYANLKEEEKYIDKGLTDDQKLIIRQNIAKDEAAATENSLESLTRKAKILQLQAKRASDAPGASAPDRTAEVMESKDEKRETGAVAAKAEAKAEVKAAEKTAKTEGVKTEVAAEKPAATDAAKPRFPDTPADQIPEEKDRSTDEQRGKIRILIKAYQWPEGEKKADGSAKSNEDLILEGLVKFGCPVQDGKVVVKLLSQTKAAKLIDNLTKGLKKQGKNPEELLQAGK